MRISNQEARELGLGDLIPKAKAKWKEPADPIALLPAGTVIAAFEVPCRARPWQAPQVTRYGVFKPKAACGWQKVVKRYALLAMAGREAYRGPVSVAFRFEMRPPESESHIPDVSNLNKNTEDALQGIVIANDTQVSLICGERVLGDRDLTTIEVVAR